MIFGSVSAAPLLIASRRIWPIATAMSWNNRATWCIWSPLNGVTAPGVTACCAAAATAFATFDAGARGAFWVGFFIFWLPRLQICDGVLKRLDQWSDLSSDLCE